MAITIEFQTNDYTGVYNDFVITASSTNVAQPSFNYIFEVYDSTNTTLLRTLRIPPEVDYSYGVANINRVLEGYVGTDFFDDVTGTEPKDAANCSLQSTIRIGEEYEVSSVITQFLNLANVTIQVTNLSLLYSNFVGFNFSDLYELDGITKKFLTNRPNPQSVQITQEGWTNFGNLSGHANFKIQTYFADGSIDQTATITNSATTDIAMFPSAPASLNAATLATGSQPLIYDGIGSYTIFAEDGAVVSQDYTFKVTDLCDYVTIHFLNDLGGFDSFNFKTAKDKWTFEKDYYKQNPKRIQSDGTYVWSNKDRENVQYYTNQKQTVRLISDWITEAESEWLREMFSSPEMYLQRDGETYSLKGITATNYDYKYEYEGEMINIECEVELSIDNYRQRY